MKEQEFDNLMMKNFASLRLCGKQVLNFTFAPQ